MSREKIAISDTIDRLKKALRLKKDTEFANIMGVKQNTVSGWRKRNSIDLHMLIEICDKYDISIDWALRGEKKNGAADVVELQHVEVIKGFENKELARDANMDLRDIERISGGRFRETCSYIKGVANTLKSTKGCCNEDKAGQRHETIDDNNPKTRRQGNAGE